MVPNRGEETAESAEREPASRRGGIRLWHIALALVLTAVISLVALRWHWRREFRGRIEALRAAGDPVTPEELDALYQWPASGDNAASWILGADEFGRALTPDEDKLLTRAIARANRWPLAEPLPDDVLKALERCITDNEKALELLHEAAAMEHSRYPIVLKSGFPTLLPHLSVVRNAVRTLCLEAVLEAQRGNAERTARSLLTAMHVADSLAGEPILISQWVRCAGIDLAIVSLERGISRVEFHEEQLQSLSAVIGGAYDADGLRRAFADDRCLGIVMFENSVALDRSVLDHLPPRFILEAYDALGLARREGVIYLDRMQRVIEAASLVPEKRLAAMRAVDGEIRRSRTWGLLLRHLWGQIIDPRHRYFVLDLNHLGYLRAAQVALAVERFRLATGGLPDSLERLVPVYLETVPRDPFDGAPLRYRKLAPGFVVYSVGEDEKDDGGRQSEGYGGPGDIAFRIER